MTNVIDGRYPRCSECGVTSWSINRYRQDGLCDNCARAFFEARQPRIEIIAPSPYGIGKAEAYLPFFSKGERLTVWRSWGGGYRAHSPTRGYIVWIKADWVERT